MVGLLCLLCCLILCPLLATSLLSAPVEQSSFVWLSTSNATVGKSANPGSPYLVLSVPLVIPSARAYLYLTNLSPHPISFEWNGRLFNSSTPLVAGQTGGFNVDNCSVGTQHDYAVWIAGVRVLQSSVSGVCVDCVLNITFTADNRTSTPTIQQPTYALQYKDRDNLANYTSDFVAPNYPSASAHPVLVDGVVPSLVLNFTFVIPILSFNFYPTSILRLLPSTSSVYQSASVPAAAPTSSQRHPFSPPVLHIPYYYTDMLNPAGTFQSGVQLTVIGGFSINPLDHYCCYIKNADNGYYSDCGPANSSDTFHCTIPRSVTAQGYDGEQFTVEAEYQPAVKGWAAKGYYMKHLVPAGDDDDNTFTVDKARVPLAWYDIRGWTMRIIIIAGGVLLIATAVLLFVLVWRRLRERRQHKEMDRRAAEEAEASDDSDAPYYLTLSASLTPSVDHPNSNVFTLAIHPSPISITPPPGTPHHSPSSLSQPLLVDTCTL